LATAVLGANLGVLPGDELAELGIVLRTRNAADLALWALLGAEQLFHARALASDPAGFQWLTADPYPAVGGRRGGLVERYGAAVVGSMPDAGLDVYHGTMGLVRGMYQRSRPSDEDVMLSPPAPALGALDLGMGVRRWKVGRADERVSLGAIPVVAMLGLTAMGIAAVIGAAWALVEDVRGRRRVEAADAVAVAKASMLGDAVRASIAAGQPVDLGALAGADFASVLKDEREREERGGWLTYATVGAAFAAGVGAAAVLR
jgi:hypothetical protein